MQAAGKFKCFVPPTFPEHRRRVLYVGKATAGEFNDEHANEKWFNNVDSPFWRLARRISELADPDCTDLSNLAWSNIFKQGVTRGNPSGKFAGGQRQAALQELKAEVDQLKPSLIVLVTGDYYDDIPKAAYQIINGEVGDQALTRKAVPGEEKWDLWSRPAYSSFPPIVWTYHPQGKRTEYVEAALALVKQVSGW